jgi:hypothetical protein
VQLSNGHIDDLLGASFAPLYVTPVQFDSWTSQPWEAVPSDSVYSTVTVSVVNDPIMENATGNIVVNKVEDDLAGSPTVPVNEFRIDATSTNLPVDDPYIPPSTNGLGLAFAQTVDAAATYYFIIGFSPAGILVSANDYVTGATISDLNQPDEPFFVISPTNLGANPGRQLTFSRNGEFDGTFPSGGTVPPVPPVPPVPRVGGTGGTNFGSSGD